MVFIYDLFSCMWTTFSCLLICRLIFNCILYSGIDTFRYPKLCSLLQRVLIFVLAINSAYSNFKALSSYIVGIISFNSFNLSWTVGSAMLTCHYGVQQECWQSLYTEFWSSASLALYFQKYPLLFSSSCSMPLLHYVCTSGHLLASAR